MSLDSHLLSLVVIWATINDDQWPFNDFIWKLGVIPYTHFPFIVKVYKKVLSFDGNLSTTNWYEWSIISMMSIALNEPSMITVFQCALFMWYPGRIAGCSSRSSMARAGSHFRFRFQSPSRFVRANILPITLKTKVVSPNGNSSVTPGFEIQYSLNSSMFMPIKVSSVI